MTDRYQQFVASPPGRLLVRRLGLPQPALMRRLAPSGRLLVLATPPEAAATPLQAAAMRALEGFVRSAGKELRGGATAQLVYVAPEAEATMESTLRFLLSARSAYVSGQVVRIDAAVPDAPDDWARPQAGRGAPAPPAPPRLGAPRAARVGRPGAHP